MGLVVADLVARFGLDAKAWDQAVDRETKSAAKKLDTVVTAAARVGDDAGRELADGVGRGGVEGADDAARGVASGEGQVTSAARRVGDSAGRGLADGVDDGAANVGDRVDDRFRAATAGLEDQGRRAGRETGRGVSDGVDQGAAGVGAGVEQRFRNETSGMPDVGRRVGEDTGGGIGDGVLDGMPDLSGGLEGVLGDALDGLPAAVAGPALAAGAAVGALVGKGFADGLENARINDELSARLAVGDAQAAEFGKVTANVYRAAWGDSTADVADAIDHVYSTLADSRRGEDALQSLTEKAMTFADVMGVDIGMVVSNAGILIETGLARDADHAFDLMTASLQRVPAAIRDELVEATHEYSVFFADLGYSGEEAMGMLVAAADGGRYAVDKTGDSLKEFAIRASDLDDTGAVEALERLGFSAEDAASKLLDGGPAARQMTSEIIAALADVEDPGEQAALAVGLMGAPIEDLSKAKIPEFLDRLAESEQQMLDSAGAADRLGSAYENSATSLEVLKREVLGGFEDGINDALSGLNDQLPGWLDPQSGTDAGVTWGQLIGEGVEFGVRNVLGPNPFQDLFDRGDSGPDPEQADQIRGFGQAIAEARADAEDAEPALSDLADSQSEVAETAEQAEVRLAAMGDTAKVAGELAAASAERHKSFVDALASSTGIDDQIGTALSLGDATKTWREQLAHLPADIDTGRLALGQYSDEQGDALQSVLNLGRALRDDLGEALRTGTPEEVVGRADMLRDSLEGQARQAGITGQRWEELLEIIGLTPDQINVALTLSGEEVLREKLQVWRDSVDTLIGADGEGVPVEIQAAVNTAQLEGDLDTANNIIDAYITDMRDGVLDNPLLLALTASDDDARGEVEELRGWLNDQELTARIRANLEMPEFDPDDPTAWLRSAAMGRDVENGVRVPVSADTSSADSDVAALRRRTVEGDWAAPIGADTTRGERDTREFGHDVASGAFGTPAAPIDANVAPALDQLNRLRDGVRANPIELPIVTRIINAGGYGTPFRQEIIDAAGGGGSKWLNRADGGPIEGPGTATSDSIPAKLSNGEYVIRAESAKKLGRDRLDYMNHLGELPAFASGGPVGPLASSGDRLVDTADFAGRRFALHIDAAMDRAAASFGDTVFRIEPPSYQPGDRLPGFAERTFNLARAATSPPSDVTRHLAAGVGTSGDPGGSSVPAATLDVSLAELGGAATQLLHDAHAGHESASVTVDVGGVERRLDQLTGRLEHLATIAAENAQPAIGTVNIDGSESPQRTLAEMSAMAKAGHFTKARR